MEIKPISSNNNDIDISIDKAYTDLYNSLGVEPGLLNKTTIGKSLIKKYRVNDSFDAKVYALKCLYGINQNDTSDEKITIENNSPFHGHDIMPVQSDIDHTLSDFIRMRQLDAHLTTDEVINEISKYLEHHAPNYYIKKFLN